MIRIVVDPEVSLKCKVPNAVILEIKQEMLRRSSEWFPEKKATRKGIATVPLEDGTRHVCTWHREDGPNGDELITLTYIRRAQKKWK